MTRLSVNINKVALLRNARGGNTPDLLQVAQDCEEFGAEGITVHPRPDERHIKYRDVRDLKPLVKTEFNVEGFPSEEFLKLVSTVKPHQVTLVPDEPGALTSDQGWKISDQAGFLQPIIARLKELGIRVSIFIDAKEKRVEEAHKVGADRVELFTGPYAEEYEKGRSNVIEDHIACAQKAYELGIGLNAGHDLNLKNLNYYVENVPHLLEVSIGHALISNALYYGLQNIISMYKDKMSNTK